MRYEYKCTKPPLPPNAMSPMMDNKEMEDWFNGMDEGGWEFVGYGQKHWTSGAVQEWWIFRRPRV